MIINVKKLINMRILGFCSEKTPTLNKQRTNSGRLVKICTRIMSKIKWNTLGKIIIFSIHFSGQTINRIKM